MDLSTSSKPEDQRSFEAWMDEVDHILEREGAYYRANVFDPGTNMGAFYNGMSPEVYVSNLVRRYGMEPLVLDRRNIKIAKLPAKNAKSLRVLRLLYIAFGLICFYWAVIAYPYSEFGLWPCHLGIIGAVSIGVAISLKYQVPLAFDGTPWKDLKKDEPDWMVVDYLVHPRIFAFRIVAHVIVSIFAFLAILSASAAAIFPYDDDWDDPLPLHPTWMDYYPPLLVLFSIVLTLYLLSQIGYARYLMRWIPKKNVS